MHRVVVVVTLAATLCAACAACDKSARSTAAPAGSAVAASSSPAAAGSGTAAHAVANDAPPSAPTVTPAIVAPAPPAAVLAHPLFWAVEKDGKTTYFFGTMHMGIDATTQLPPIIWNKLDAAKTFAMEADLDDPNIASMIKPTKGSLHQALGDAYWKKLEDAMGATMAKAVDNLPPMVPAAVLSVKGLPPTQPMDKALSIRATDARKPIVFLEPAVRQLEILGKWMDIKALKMILDELPDAEQHAQAMLGAYAEGNDRKILAINDNEKTDALQHGYTAAEYDQEMTDLLYNRNASWITPLEKLHAAGGGFVAVGALHLLGRRSVLELLARKGYKVTRVVP